MPAPVTTPLRSIIALLIALLLTLPLTLSATAQNLESTAGQLNIEDLEGITRAAARSYAMDISDIIEAVSNGTPVAMSNGTPRALEAEGPVLMLALVAEFDSPEHAAEAAGTVRDRLLEQTSDNTGIELEATEIEDLGEVAFEITGRSESGESVGGFIVKDASVLHFTIAISENDTSSNAARELIEFTLSNQASNDEVIYDHTGASRGGIWAKFPGANDESALSGTQPIFDSQLVPALDEDVEN